MIGTKWSIAWLTAVPIAPEELSTFSSAGDSRSEEHHGAVSCAHDVAASHLLDLAHLSLYALDRGLRPPAERVTPKASLELPVVGLGLRHALTNSQCTAPML